MQVSKVRFGLGLPVALVLWGCSSWHTVQRAELNSLSAERTPIRVVQTSGAVYESRSYFIRDDSLYLEHLPTLLFNRRRTAVIPLSTVLEVQAQAGRPAEMVLGVTAVAISYVVFRLARDRLPH